MGREAVVVGGGLAGLSAALACADAGLAVTLVERRPRLGGLTWSFRRQGRWYDNGQHIFLRCCTGYRGFLERIGAGGEVFLQERLEVPVLRPGRPTAWLRRSDLPAPLHLAGSLARYGPLGMPDRLRLVGAALPLSRLDPADPSVDGQAFGPWLGRHGQRPAAVAALWNLIALPTLNLSAADASLAAAAKVFQTGLLTQTDAADIGWSNVPLGRLHGERACAALSAVGAQVLTGERVTAVESAASGRLAVRTERQTLAADLVIVAIPHDAVAAVLPGGAVAGVDRFAGLGRSPIVNVHVVYDRRVTATSFAATIGTPVQWVFDRTRSSGLERGQYLAVSLSGADAHVGRRAGDLATEMLAALADLFPEAGRARVVDVLVTRERAATFRATPGSGSLRPGPRTAVPGLYLAGAWTATGWPATMEGAVRSGLTAAAEALGDLGAERHVPREVA